MNVVGYARVSKREQNPAAQEAELRAAGASRVFVDHGESSRITDRPQWLACLDYLRDGDTLLVRRLDRLGGTERIIIETLHDLDRRGVNIKSLTEPMIDTTTPMGRALFGMVAVFAQLRVDTIRENTMRGLAHAVIHSASWRCFRGVECRHCLLGAEALASCAASCSPSATGVAAA